MYVYDTPLLGGVNIGDGTTRDDEVTSKASSECGLRPSNELASNEYGRRRKRFGRGCNPTSGDEADEDGRRASYE